MKLHGKILFGLFITISFNALVVLIAVSDMVTGSKLGFDVGAFTLYSGTMIGIAKIKPPKEKGV